MNPSIPKAITLCKAQVSEHQGKQRKEERKEMIILFLKNSEFRVYEEEKIADS